MLEVIYGLKFVKKHRKRYFREKISIFCKIVKILFYFAGLKAKMEYLLLLDYKLYNIMIV